MSRRSTVLLAFLALEALLLGAAHFPRFDSQSSTRSRLADALGPRRFAEGRMMGGFAYAPFDPAQGSFRPSKELRTVLRDVEENARGLAQMIDGRPRQAVEELEKRAAAGSAGAALFSDLAVAYLEDARKNQEPYSLVKALENAEKAVALDPRLPEARFNRAAALESLFLDQQARSAWQEYLRIDSQSGWAAEAKKRLRALPETGVAARRWQAAKRKLDAAVERGDSASVDEIVTFFPQASREYAEEVLLGEWAEALKAGRTEEVQRALKKAHAIGNILRLRNGDRMTADAVTVIEEITKAGPGRRVKALEEGHRWYLEGLRLYQDGRLAEAREKFQNAERRLIQAGSPFAAWAAFRLAVCEMQRFDYPRALTRLDGIRFGQAGRSYRSLVARSQWVAGLINVIQTRPTEAFAAYRKAFSIFDHLGEHENRAIVSALIAESLWSSGDLRGALPYHFSALRSIRYLRDPVRRQVVLEGSGLTALSMAEPLVALAFQQEAIANLENSSNAAAWIYCLRRRAMIETFAGQTERARLDLADARKRLAEVSDKALRDSLLGDILAVDGQLYSTESPQKAVTRLSEVIGIYRDTGYQTQLALFLGLRAQAQAALGHLDLAEADYAEAILEINRQNDATMERDLRDWFLTRSRSIFQEMIQLQAKRGDIERALSYAESGRVQLLRAHIPDKLAVMSAAEISERIPPGVALVEFWVADQQLHSWVVRRGSIDALSTRIAPGTLGRRIDRLRRKIWESEDSQWKEDSRVLFNLLIGPLEPFLGGAGTIILVPDEDLYNLPFAALLDSTDRYLVERYALVVSPSASLYTQALARQESRGSTPLRSVLSLGDPALDREVLPNLPRLPQAREEAIRIADFYSQAEVRVGAEATKKAFLKGLATYDVVHFAGHAVVNSVEPSSSFLALASSRSEGESGILYSRDLYDMPDPGARLVVLSACSTIFGASQVGEGLSGLARPFLYAGIPAVLGSLWSVNDQPSLVFFAEFHHHLREGLGAAAALRAAQLSLLSSPEAILNRPASWAGFQLIGAGR
jgi:CHAT domain-containing protein